MKLTSRLVALFFMMFAVILTVACAPNSIIPPVNTPESTISITVALTTTPTVTPSPVPTATPISSEERRAELNHQIHDFLNCEGEYSHDKIHLKMNKYEFSDKQIENLKLGLFYADLGGAQGVLLDYEVRDEYIVIFVGFERDDGSRFITPLAIPSYFYSGSDKPDFIIYKYISLSKPDYSIFYSGSDLLEIERCLAGEKGSLLEFTLTAFDEVPKDVLLDEEIMSNDGGRNGRFLNEIISKMDIYKKLREEVASNGVNIEPSSSNTSDVSDVQITLVNSADNTSLIDMSTVPVFVGFGLIN